MKTQIIGVLGLGIFGQTLATELSSFGQDVIALDLSLIHIFIHGQNRLIPFGNVADITFFDLTAFHQELIKLWKTTLDFVLA